MGDFDAWSSSLGVRITPTTRLSFNSFVQFDNQSESIGLNHRFPLHHKVGQRPVLCLQQGFHKGYDREFDDFRSFKTESIAKLGWTFQF